MQQSCLFQRFIFVFRWELQQSKIIIYMNRLTRIKTTYSETAKYDEEEYFQEQKRVYNREIAFSNRVTAITEEQFALKPLQIGFMQSTALKEHPKFKEIKKILTEYNKSVMENQGKAINGLHLKTVVMQSMLKFMRLMMMAPDTGSKVVILDIAHYWFIRHLDPTSGKKSTNELEKQIKNILVKKQLLPIDIINKELILTRVQETLRPYRLKARTMYKQLDSPDVELRNYHTHKLEFLSAQSNEALQKQNKRWIDTVKFPKIQAPAYYFQAQVEPERYYEEAQEIPKNPTNEQKDPQQPQQPGDANPVDGQPLQGQKPKEEQNPAQQDLDFGGAGGEAEPEEEEPAEEEQQKQKGKLDPLLKVFLLERIRSKQKEEIVADRKFEHKYNKINKTQMEDYEEMNYMRNWAAQKARLKTQINKKHQSMKGVEKIPRGRGAEDKTFIENEMEKLKIQRVIGEHEKHITQIDKPSEPLNAQAGLSMFDKRRVKTEASQKPFSTILEDYSKKNQLTEGVQEIGYLKQRLAKYRLYTPVDTLAKGLLQPLEKDEQLEEESDGKVVWPNSQMLSNPFFKVAKKKKKKKKKK